MPLKFLLRNQETGAGRNILFIFWKEIQCTGTNNKIGDRF